VGGGETFLFVADDAGPAFSVTAHPELFELHSPRSPDVEVRASAETLYRFVWGRATPADVDASGDTALLDRWHERIRV
jgi:hypothetical protein